MARSSLLEDDLLDTLFKNAAPELDTGTLNVSLHSGELPEQEVEVKGVTWEHPNHSPELKTVETIDLRVENEQIKSCKPGDLISITDGQSTRCFQIRSMEFGHTHTNLKCETYLGPSGSPTPAIETHVDYPEVEECALDIDVELGLSQRET